MFILRKRVDTFRADKEICFFFYKPNKKLIQFAKLFSTKLKVLHWKKNISKVFCSIKFCKIRIWICGNRGNFNPRPQLALP